MKISANIIVKNESFFLPYTLESIYKVVDEILILDNGSDDDTIEKINIFKSKVDIPVHIYENTSLDFAFLRNLLMEKSIGDWIFIADGDEVFYTDGKHSILTIKEYLEKLHPSITAMWIQFYHFYGSFNHIINHVPHAARRFIKNGMGINWGYDIKDKLIHEVLKGDKLKLFNSPDYYYAHYGYCKSNKDIWLKGKNYYERGYPNGLYRPNDYPDWEQKIPSVLNGTEVSLFTGEHPQIMKDFDFNQYKVDLEKLENGNFKIKEKYW